MTKDGGANLRQGKMEDVETIANFNCAMAEETEGLQLDRGVVIEGVQAVMLDAAKGRYYVIEEEGQVVSCLLITFEWSDWRNSNYWWIQSVYTHPSYRRRGHFSRLFKHVVTEGRAAGAAAVRLYADSQNQRAQEVYRKLGMTSHYLVFETQC